ncbi:DUF3152 domain-containing protein [Gordonia pseudamarae]|jgi:hypothetical protein|uniref:DUF3152 domain-containing protein n=1 Tax=Gordonia pseudamarae TaxID=2831662 RepID=A0ABX6IPC8_9ACTN|nr:MULTISPECIES: DUF3152 domain-containing protein [Gordonia]MBD0022721.1 DUF3152 domain-containing protein [Gordonia sp. (in: high G+C Gram-positive bacteria)]QHN28774.1 DUF3152 domain-containing protein [Gordonia pseudamarae]QHN37650.1 DUF3152 domain-containing protein [Gordonia pseudamarae]
MSAGFGTGGPAWGRRNRPYPDQPLRARWDPTDSSGRRRVDRDAQPEPKQRSALGRFVSTYGWRAYMIPALTVLTVVLLVLTIRNGEPAALDDGPADLTARNLDINKTTTAVGAPSEQVNPDAMPAGVLPAGGPFTAQGEKVYHQVREWGAQVGTGQVYTYTVEVEDGVDPQNFGGEASFAKMVDATLANRRSWIGDGKIAFRRVISDNPDMRISLSSSGTARELCGYQIKLETSCYYPPDKRVVLNEARWVRGAHSYQGDDLLYRQYLINHEVGHGIGYEHHLPCPRDGALAPVMMQQSFGVSNKDILTFDPDIDADPSFVCTPNPWPFPDKG